MLDLTGTQVQFWHCKFNYFINKGTETVREFEPTGFQKPGFYLIVRLSMKIIGTLK